MSSCLGVMGVVCSIVGHYALRCLTCCRVQTKTRAIPAVQWFPDRRRGHEIRGRTQLRVLPKVSVEWAVKNCRGRWETMQSMKLVDLNLQLIGGAGGCGTARMDFGPEEVRMHSCLERDTTSYGAYSLRTNSSRFSEETLIAWNPKADICDFLCHPETGLPQAVYFEEERTTKRVLDHEIANDLQFLDSHFPKLDVSVIDRCRSDETWVINVQGDSCPGDYYLYDRGQRALAFMFASRPQLAGLTFASQQPVQVPARDGETLLCYVSRPSNFSCPGPMVLWIHGGPMARDSWGFDPEVQLLCSRGMAVLQVNYRSSIGFGRRFMKLPYGKLETVPQDIADATSWAITDGIADPARIAIAGGSWGGYLSLCGMTKNSELFVAGLALVPVSSIGAAGGLSFRGDPLIKMYWDEMYGPEVVKDKKAAEAVSPLYHTDQIKRPLMVVTCLKDPRVKPEQGAAIVNALKKRDVPCYFVTYADEGHGLRKECNLLDFWHRAECFLCRCLSLPQPPPLDSVWTEGTSATVEFDGMGDVNA